VALIPSDIHSSKTALVIFQLTKYGRRLAAAFRTMRRQVAALHILIHRADDDQGQQDKD